MKNFKIKIKKPKIRMPLPTQRPYVKASSKLYNRKRKHKKLQSE